jgi:hypothetical protein
MTLMLRTQTKGDALSCDFGSQECYTSYLPTQEGIDNPGAEMPVNVPVCEFNLKEFVSIEFPLGCFKPRHSAISASKEQHNRTATARQAYRNLPRTRDFM